MVKKIKDDDKTGLVNFRDLGGIKTADGRKIKAGRILRSDSLGRATPEDLQKLQDDYHLKTVVDLRTAGEVDRYPDQLPPHVTYVFNPVVDELKEFFPKNLQESTSNYFAKLAAAIEHGYVDAEKLLSNSYQGYASDAFSINAYRNLFKLLLASPDGSLLYHCSAGKDRTGFATVLILAALGVNKEDIYADYLKTNENVKAVQDKAVAMANAEKTYAEDINQQIRDFLGVRKVWLDSVFKLIEKKYGNIDNYLRQVLHLSAEKLADLRDNYLEPENTETPNDD